jgi:hypothetical protein
VLVAPSVHHQGERPSVDAPFLSAQL